MNKEVGKKILEARTKKRWTQEDMAGKLGMTMRQYNKYEAGDFPKYKGDVVKEIDKLLGTKAHEEIYEQSVPRELNGSAKKNIIDLNAFSLDDLQKDPQTLLNVIAHLARGNESLISAHQTIADTNKLLAKRLFHDGTTTDQIPEQKSPAVSAISGPLLEVLAEIASGTRYRSKEEAIASLGMKLSVQVGDNDNSLNTLVDGGKKHTA